MKVIVLSNSKFEEKEIESGLKALQEIVEGYIEIPYLSDKLAENRIDVIINEEGKLIDGMQPEIAIIHKGEIQDIIFGNCIFASSNDDGETIGLSDSQVNLIYKELKSGTILFENEVKSVKVLQI